MSILNGNDSNNFQMKILSPINTFEFNEKILYKNNFNYPTKSTRENTVRNNFQNQIENKIESYWEKRSLENKEKMQKIINEQNIKEFGELKNKPTISKESINIAKKLSDQVHKRDLSGNNNKNLNINAAEIYNEINMEVLRKKEKNEKIKKFKEQILKKEQDLQPLFLSEPNQIKSSINNNNNNINNNSNNNKLNSNYNYYINNPIKYRTSLNSERQNSIENNNSTINYKLYNNTTIKYPYFSPKQIIYTKSYNPIKITNNKNDLIIVNPNIREKKIKKTKNQNEEAKPIGENEEINLDEAKKKNEINVEDIKPIEINETDFKKFFGEDGNLDNVNLNQKLKNTKTVTFLEPMNTSFAVSKSKALLLSRKASKKSFLSKYDLKSELNVKGRNNNVSKLISNVSSIEQLNIKSNDSSKRSSKELLKVPSKKNTSNLNNNKKEISRSQSIKSNKSTKSKIQSNNIGIMVKESNVSKNKINESIHSNKSKVSNNDENSLKNNKKSSSNLINENINNESNNNLNPINKTGSNNNLNNKESNNNLHINFNLNDNEGEINIEKKSSLKKTSNLKSNLRKMNSLESKINESNHSNQNNKSNIKNSVKNSSSNLSQNKESSYNMNNKSKNKINESYHSQIGKNIINESIHSDKNNSFIKIEESSPIKSINNEEKNNESLLSDKSKKNKSRSNKSSIELLNSNSSKNNFLHSNSINSNNSKNKISKTNSIKSNKNNVNNPIRLNTDNSQISKKLSQKNSLISIKEKNENENNNNESFNNENNNDENNNNENNNNENNNNNNNDYIELKPKKNNYKDFEFDDNNNKFADIVISKIKGNLENNEKIENDIFNKFDNSNFNENNPWLNFREENNKRLQDLNKYKIDFIEEDPKQLSEESKKIISRTMKLKVTNNFINGEYNSFDSKINYLNQRLDLNNEKKKNLLSNF